jgi:hypothetical protein
LKNHGGPTETIALMADSNATDVGRNPIHGVTFFTDQRGYVPTSGVWDVGAYQLGAAPAAAPTATLDAANVGVSPGYGQTSYTFTVTYAGVAGITPGSIAGAVVEVVPPAGLGGPIVATANTSVANGPTDPWGDAQSFTVNYTITPPRGQWTSADNGTYTVTFGGTPVTDTNGTPIPAGSVGTFEVETAKIAIFKFGLLPNRRTGLWSGTIHLQNTGDSAFSGPIFVLFTPPAGVILENATGTYGGLPYLKINVDTLAAGAYVSATVIFNKNVSAASYSTSYFIGSLGS